MIDLYEIKDPSFIKELNIKELRELCQQIRQFLIEKISKTGGHLSSNLGVVELTVAMYYVFDPEVDKFLFDVGHQSYVHKILTGRARDFDTLRQFDGMSGYINKNESKYDIWESGHSSTSISAMSGIMLGKNNPQSRVVSVIGDTSIMNGVALEGLNFLGQMHNSNPIVILNDNKMGISRSVGALSRNFNKLRRTKFVRGVNFIGNKIATPRFSRFCHRIKRSIKGFFLQDNLFEDMGFDYYGPYDGHNLKYLIKMFTKVKECKNPLVIHILTVKGKGYKPSEEDTVGDFHGIGAFNVETGKPLCEPEPNVVSYSKLVADYLIRRREDENFYVVTPAMKAGSKLNEFAAKYPKDFYDVGIAEEHAAVMSAGLALEGNQVVLLMYSTFAQRAYDYLLNDIARQDIKLVIGLDRAGIVGEDGSTHQGLYDVSMLMAMPNIIVTMPRNAQETINLFNYAFKAPHAMVIRYPRGNVYAEYEKLNFLQIGNLSWEILNDGNKGIILSYGPDVERLSKIVSENNLDITVVDAKSIKPIDEACLNSLFNKNIPMLCIEQAINSGTLYDKLLEFKEKNNYNTKIYSKGFDCNTIIPHGKIKDVYDAYGLSDAELLKLIMDTFLN